MTAAIVVPTIDGRELDLKRCLAAYKRTAPHARIIIEHGHPSCGAAWIAGAEQAARDGFDYLHLTADDLEPLPGWLAIAKSTADKGMIPAPHVLRPDGQLESAGLIGFALNGSRTADMEPVDGTTVPFLTREMWEAFIAIPGFASTMTATHYATDLMCSFAGRANGWPTVVRASMRFVHYTAPAGRNYGRAHDDTNKYIAWTQEVA
jgi:hypothetical protein